MSGAHVLVVDDDDYIRDMVGAALRYAGFATDVAADGREALAKVATQRPALVVLDAMMPVIDGYEVCRRLRAQGDGTPVIFLTARAASRDLLEGFGCGADDYVVKPFVLDELVARIRAVLHRTGALAGGSTLRCGDLELDEEHHRVRRAGRPVELSPTEFKLLRYLMINPGRVVSKEQILDRVWGYDFDGDGHVVETYISVLRRKLDHDREASLIRTVRGVGYAIEPGADDGGGG